MFLFALFFLPFIAWWYPELGDQKGFFPVEECRSLCIIGLFFINGLMTHIKHLKNKPQLWSTSCILQLGSFVVTPLVASTFVLWWLPWMEVDACYTPGVLLMAFLPTTTGACVTFCQLAKVPTSYALLNSIAGNGIGMVILPWILPFLFHMEGVTPYQIAHTLVNSMAFYIALPLIIGILIAYLSRRPIWENPLWQPVGNCFLLYIIYSAYCDSFVVIEKAAALHDDLVALALGLLLLHLVMLFASLLLGYLGKLSYDTRMTLLFTIPQKTVAMGLPLISALFPIGCDGMNGKSGAIWAATALPLLLYNNIQNMSGTITAWWIRPSKKKRAITAHSYEPIRINSGVKV